MKKTNSPFKRFLRLSIAVPLGGALGVRQLNNNNQFIKGMWQSLNNPKCPHCPNGVLFTSDSLPSDKKGAGDTLTIYGCNKCEYIVSSKPSELRGLIHQQQTINNLKFIQHNQNSDEIQKRIKSLMVNSRIMYLGSLVPIIYFFYLIISGGSLILAINCFFLSLPLFASGMVRSYRCYQLKTNSLYITGGFMRWIKNERWFV